MVPNLEGGPIYSHNEGDHGSSGPQTMSFRSNGLNKTYKGQFPKGLYQHQNDLELSRVLADII